MIDLRGGGYELIELAQLKFVIVVAMFGGDEHLLLRNLLCLTLIRAERHLVVFIESHLWELVDCHVEVGMVLNSG